MARKSVIRLLSLFALLLVGLAGCGGSGESSEPPPAAGIDAPNAPQLLTDPEAPGEFLFHADFSPQTFGPVTLDGGYTVRFVQYAPEDAEMDFSSQTLFMASLVKVSGKGPKEIPLFQDAARSGQTRVSAEGTYELEVSFGDFPFVIRFTPV